MSTQKKYNKLKKYYKRNLSFLNISKTYLKKNTKNKIVKHLNLNKREHSNLNTKNINLLNNYYNEKDIEKYKNSFCQ